MKLELISKQAPILTPKLLGSIEILQMSSQELLEYAAAAAEENPVLELDGGERREAPVIVGEFSGAHEWPGKGEDFELFADVSRIPDCGDAEGESLADHLLAQLESLGLGKQQLAAAVLLAESLDGNGRLDESIEEIAEASRCSLPELEEALKLLQSLEPAGVGARNLRECLLLQLERYYPDEALAREIAENHLEALARLRYNSIAAKTQSDIQQVQEACRLIRSLDPRPGRAFSPEEMPEYVVPDVMVSLRGSRFEIRLNEHCLPTLGISFHYSALAEKSDDPELKSYLREKLREGRWLLSAIEQRHKTLCGCVACLVRLQEEFFAEGRGKLVPLSLADIACEVGVHESTVSRALKGKYLQCDSGVYPMSYFFSRSFSTADGTNSASPESVKAMLRAIIEAEDKSSPLSDSKLCDKINESGCSISRRTVAKYRDEMNIPNAAVRKRSAETDEMK